MKDKVKFSQLGSNTDSYTHTVLKVAHGHVEGQMHKQELTGVIAFHSGEVDMHILLKFTCCMYACMCPCMND